MTFAAARLIVAYAIFLWAVAVCCAVLWTIAVPWVPKWVQRWLSRRVKRLPALKGNDSIVIVRPCAGGDAFLLSNLQGVPVLPEGAKWCLRVAVSETTDGSYLLAQQAVKALVAKGLDAELVLTRAQGPNNKCAQLSAVMALHSQDAMVIVADSDVDLESVDLRGVVESLKLGEAARWVVVRERLVSSRATWGDAVSQGILSGSLHSFALLSRIDKGSFVGKLFAVRTDALASMGGFAALTRHLGEDLELARRLQDTQFSTLAETTEMAWSNVCGRSVGQVRDRFARWLLVLRKQRPALLLSYPLLFLAPWIQSIIAVVLLISGQHNPVLVVTIVIAFVARQLAYIAARRACRIPVLSLKAWSAAIVSDWVLAWAWVHSFTLDSVRWRDRELFFGADGLLREQR